MKIRGIVGAVAGILLFASALAHAYTGWPPLREALAGSGVGAGLVDAIAAGWFFGSASMPVFGVIVSVTAVDALRCRPVFKDEWPD